MCRSGVFMTFLVVAVVPRSSIAQESRHSAAGEFTLTVWERAGVPRVDEPVSVGVPFSRGEVFLGNQIGLSGQDGHPVACQVSPLVTWPDKSLKWALLDFQATVPANARAEYRVEYGPDIQPAPATAEVTIEESDTGYLVDTGLIRFEVPKDRGLFFRDVQIRGKDGSESLFCRGGAEAVISSYFLRHYFTSDNTAEWGHNVELVQSGPSHALFKATGHHQLEKDGGEMPYFAYEVRLHAYAGQRFLRLFYTFINTTDVDPSCISGVSIRAPVPEDSRNYAFGLSAGPPKEDWPWPYVSAVPSGLVREGTVAPREMVTLTQDGPTVTSIHTPFSAAWRERAHEWREAGGWHQEGLRLPGWVDFGNGRAGLTVAVRDFWQLHPKSLTVRSADAPLGKRDYPYTYTYSDHPDEERAAIGVSLVPTQIGQPLIFTVGAAKTHELFLDFHLGDHREANTGERSAAFQNPLRAVVDPQWICESKVFGDLLPVDPGTFPRYESRVEDGFRHFLGETERLREYGMMDYGDCLTGAAFNSWTNLEYDLHHALFLLYARSGDPAYFDRAETAARHFMDIDVLHYHPDPGRRGMVYKHRYFHVGRRDRELPAPKLDHSFVEGLFDYYCLTGDECSLQVGREVADFFERVANTPGAITSQQERAMGWPMLGLVAAYRTTGDRRYLDAAGKIVELSLQRQHDQLGAWRSYTDEQGNVRWTSKPFMVGILMEGLRAYHEETGDERVAGSIVLGAQWLVRHSRETGEVIDRRALEGLVYAYQLSDERELLEAAAECLDRILRDEVTADWTPNEKAFATFTRSTPRVLPVLAGEGAWKKGRPVPAPDLR